MVDVEQTSAEVESLKRMFALPDTGRSPRVTSRLQIGGTIRCSPIVRAFGSGRRLASLLPTRALVQVGTLLTIASMAASCDSSRPQFELSCSIPDKLPPLANSTCRVLASKPFISNRQTAEQLHS